MLRSLQCPFEYFMACCIIFVHQSVHVRDVHPSLSTATEDRESPNCRFSVPLNMYRSDPVTMSATLTWPAPAPVYVANTI